MDWLQWTGAILAAGLLLYLLTALLEPEKFS